MSTSPWPIIQHGVSESPNYVKQKEMKVNRNVDIIKISCKFILSKTTTQKKEEEDNIVVKNMKFWKGSYQH